MCSSLSTHHKHKGLCMCMYVFPVCVDGGFTFSAMQLGSLWRKARDSGSEVATDTSYRPIPTTQENC